MIAWHILVLVALSAVLLVGGGALSSRMVGRSLLDRVMSLVVTSLSLVVALLLVAGVAGILRPVPVACLEGGATAVLLTATGGPRRTAAWFSALGADLLAVARRWPALWRRPWLVVLLAVSGAELLWRAALTLVLPPTGFDALEYHLTTVAWWLQRGGFGRNPLDAFSAGYPANTELLFTHVALFTHDARLVGLTQLALAVVGALATAALGRTMGAARADAATAGCVFFLTPVLLAQSRVAYVDVAAATTLVCSLYFLLRFASPDEGDRTSPVVFLGLSGLGAGLCLGTKVTGLPWVSALALVVAVLLVWRTRRGRLSPMAALGTGAVFLAGSVALGGYWYVHDLVQYHDPVYPQMLALLGTVVFPGRHLVDAAPSYRSFPANVAWSWAHDLLPFVKTPVIAVDQRDGGLGPAFVYVLLPLSAVLAVQTALRRSGRRAAIVTLVAAVCLGWLLSPYAWWSRFTLQLAAAGAALAAVTLTGMRHRRLGRLPLRGAVASVLALAALVGAANATRSTDVVPSAHGPLSLSAVLRLATHPAARNQLDPGGLTVAAAAPAGATVAVDPANVTFSFAAFGAGFQHRVVAVDLTTPDLGAELGALHAQYVFTAPALYLQRPADVSGRGLTLVRALDGYRLYRVAG